MSGPQPIIFLQRKLSTKLLIDIRAIELFADTCFLLNRLPEEKYSLATN